jgi:hypothetical protein
MSERQNNLVCIFDLKSPRITAFQIHEWIYETMKLPETDVSMIQIDGPKRHIYIKFAKSPYFVKQMIKWNSGMILENCQC